MRRVGKGEQAEQGSRTTSEAAEPEQGPLVAVVGPCAAGKSLLVDTLCSRGINAREVAQEHSYIPDMWLRITAPDLLVFLDVSLEESQRRRPTDITGAAWAELVRRLDHARASAHLYLHTDGLTPDQIVQRVLEFLGGPAAPRGEAGAG
jgi:hypothetical protein